MIKLTVTREVKFWIEDTYEVPDSITKKEAKQLDKGDGLEKYFQERDMYALIENGGATIETGNKEFNLDK